MYNRRINFYLTAIIIASTCMPNKASAADPPPKFFLEYDFRTLAILGLIRTSSLPEDQKEYPVAASTSVIGVGFDMINTDYILGKQYVDSRFSLINLSAYFLGVSWNNVALGNSNKVDYMILRAGPHVRLAHVPHDAVSLGFQTGFAGLFKSLDSDKNIFGIDFGITLSIWGSGGSGGYTVHL